MLNEINDEINNEINNSNNEIENKSETNEDGFLDSIYKQGNGAFTNKQNLYSGNEFNLEEMTKVTQSDALNFAPKNKRRMLLSWKTLLPSALAICLVFGGLIFMLTSQSPANTSKIGNTAEGALPAASASIAPIASGKLFADIQGEVNKAGLYELENGSRISDLIKAAGGLKKDADASSVNQARKLTDGEQVFITKKGENANASQNPNGASTSGKGGASGANAGGGININTADLSQLDSLTGIGPAIAQRIIDYRTENGSFQSIEDIKNVKGIGDSLFGKIKDQIRV